MERFRHDIFALRAQHQTSCHVRATAALGSDGKQACLFGSADGIERQQYAIRLTNCELEAAGVPVPDSCAGVKDNSVQMVNQCTLAYAAVPQLWTSYSTTLKHAQLLCWAMRADVETENLVSIHRTFAHLQEQHSILLQDHVHQMDDFQSYQKGAFEDLMDSQEESIKLASETQTALDTLKETFAAVIENTRKQSQETAVSSLALKAEADAFRKDLGRHFNGIAQITRHLQSLLDANSNSVDNFLISMEESFLAAVSKTARVLNDTAELLDLAKASVDGLNESLNLHTKSQQAMLQQFEHELSTGLGESALQLKEMMDSIELVSHVQSNVILNLTQFEARFDRTIAALTGSLETLSEISTEAIEKHASVISLFMPYLELLNIGLNVAGYAINFFSRKAFQFCMGSIALLSNFQPLKQHRKFLLFSTAVSTTIAASEIIISDSQAKVGFSVRTRTFSHSFYKFIDFVLNTLDIHASVSRAGVAAFMFLGYFWSRIWNFVLKNLRSRQAKVDATSTCQENSLYAFNQIPFCASIRVNR
ncbi:hypothetical protein HDU77_001993 [Chytriomyces hyalinus]|nr:hypothetical protein HDU77_001993 [Chytriomyces hyalinus]